jgi:hypothetical protein
MEGERESGEWGGKGKKRDSDTLVIVIMEK